MEASLSRFQAAHTQVLGVSIDSVFSHANWAQTLGGVSFPLLADFHPKGTLAQSLGVYLEGAGITDRATIIIDSSGVVRYAESVGPGGQRNIDDLAAACEKIDGESSGATSEVATPAGLPAGTVVYVKNNCGASRAVTLACENLHLGGSVTIKNVSDDASAAAELEKTSGSSQAPCMVVDGKAMQESGEIVNFLVDKAAVPIG